MVDAFMQFILHTVTRLIVSFLDQADSLRKINNNNNYKKKKKKKKNEEEKE